MLTATPTIHVMVNNKFLTNSTETGATEGYLVAVKCVENRPLLFTVHLKNGALYSGLPINALYHIEKTAAAKLGKLIELEHAQPWSCLAGPVNCVELPYLKNYDVEIRSPDLVGTGMYLFTIDYHGGNLAADPTQYKLHNIISLDGGPLVAMPNNYCRFPDRFFTDEESSLAANKLRRTTTYYRTY